MTDPMQPEPLQPRPMPPTPTEVTGPTEGVEFTETLHRPLLSRGVARGGLVAGAGLLFAIGVISVMAASPSPSTGADPSTGTDPSAGASAAPVTPAAPNGTTPTAPNGTTNDGTGRMPMLFGGAPMMGDGGFGMGRGIGFGDVTITAINGSDLSLKTDDGWTRTITVASGTTITRAGKTIAVGDLKAGDQIVFAEQKGTDGTYTITAIRVVVPTVFGQVTKIDGSTITVQTRGGTTETIHVGSGTTYTVNGVTNPSLSDIKVGDGIVAQGTQRSDGSLDAESVTAGQGGWDLDGDGGHGWHTGPGWDGQSPNQTNPNASPAPSSSAG